MNLLIKSGNKELEKNFKNLDNHSVKIVDNISSKDFSNNDCLRMRDTRRIKFKNSRYI